MIRVELLTVTLSGFALRGINLEVGQNEFFILMGPTGAGKTVLLEGIAGLVPLSGGHIYLNEREISGLPPEKRGISIVYQDHALFPHLSVRENIRYGLRYHRVERSRARAQFERLVEGLRIGHLLERTPVNLSGGEKQRVALARALMVDPGVLLLDEPVSALDPAFREEVRGALKRLQETSGVTFLMVTHDFAEARALATRGAVINQGQIEQVGTIDDIFQKPSSIFVADFVGMKNIFRAEFSETRTRVNGLELELGREIRRHEGHIAIRPEDIRIGLESSPGAVNRFKGTVSGILDRGFSYEVQVRVGQLTFKSLMTRRTVFERGIREGAEVTVSFDTESIHGF